MNTSVEEKWTVPDLVFSLKYKVVDQNGYTIAGAIPDEGMAHLIAQLPQLKELRYEWATIINRLANIALDGADSNERDYAQEMIEMVGSYLSGAVLDLTGKGE